MTESEIDFQRQMERQTSTMISYETVTAAMAKAVAMVENLNPDGSINWNFVDADAFMELAPNNWDVDKFYCLFDEIAEEQYS